MPINVFGNSNSNDNNNEIDTSLFEQKPYLRTFFSEANIEEDIDLKIKRELKTHLILLALQELVVKTTLIIYSTIIV